MPVKKYSFALLLSASLLGVATASTHADDTPPEKPSPQALSPAVEAAINDLAADNYNTRQNAVKKLELALAQQMRAIVASDDPEIQARIIAVLQFNDGLSRWISDAYKLPPDERKATIAFGLEPDMLPVLALAFSADADKRVQAAHELAKIDKPEATKLLGHLMDDDDRAVYLAAMEAVWDKKPNQAIVDSLWDRAVDSGMRVYRGNYTNGVAEQNLKFRGHAVPAVSVYDSTLQRRMQDSTIAADVLIHLNAPQVDAKIKAFLEEYEKATSGSNRNNIWVYSGNSVPMKNAIRIIGAHKSKDTFKLLFKIATNPMIEQSQGNANGQKYFWSNRTTALATLVEALDLKPDDYKLKRATFMGGIWTTPTEADENDALKKLRAYWEAHPEISDPKNAPQTPAPKTADATQPANTTEPAQPALPALPAAQNQRRILIQHGPIGGVQIQITPAPPEK